MSNKKDDSPQKKDSPFFYLIIAMVFCYCAFYVGQATYENIVLQKNGVEGTVKVLELLEVSRYRTRDYYPIVSMQGQKLTGSRSCFHNSYKRGQTVNIIYLKEDPHTFIINDFGYRWGYLWNNLKAWFVYFSVLYGLLYIFSPARTNSKYAKAIARTR